MIAIAQSGSKYHYLNWIPTESGPLVIHQGHISKKFNYSKEYKQYQFEILSEIISKNNIKEPICTFSLERHNLLIYDYYEDSKNPELFDWYRKQIKDENLNDKMDYYYYPMAKRLDKQLAIAIPKIIRESFQQNMQTLRGCLHSLSFGIFSAENGARNWFHADKIDNYVIWKIGASKIDEILFINQNELESYFSITRSSKQIKINWQYGNPTIMDTFCTYIQGLINDQKKNENPFEKIFIYTSNGKIQDVKFFESQGGKNMILLNPLAVLKMMDNKKVNIYETLPLAETGNAFGKVDV